jgi:hypothetical protein
MKSVKKAYAILGFVFVIFGALPAFSQVVAEGTYTSQYRPSVPTGSGIDARNAYFIASQANNYPVYIASGSYLTGGTVSGNFDVNQSWSYFSSVGGTGLYLYLSQQTPFVVEGLRLDNHHDGIRLRRNVQNFVVRNIHFTNIHDDCLENDFYYSGLVEDALLDGCYVAFSARQGSNPAVGGPNEIWTIRNSLVRQQPFVAPYSGPSPGHGPTFKLGEDAEDGTPPKLSLHGNIFRLDQRPSHGAALIPPGARIDSCSNNIVVWLGGGSFPGGLGTDPSSGQPCFAVTTDVSVWDNAKADWLARHGSGGSQPQENNLTLSPGKLDFTGVQGGTNPSGKTVSIAASNGTDLSWTATSGAAWLSLSSQQGTSPSNVTVNANTSGLAAGTYLATVSISAPGADNSPLSIPVSLTVSPSTTPPPPSPTPPSSGPAITSPAAGATLAGASANFTWNGNGTNVKKWQLYVGTSRGSRNIHDSGKLNNSTTSRTVSGIPTDGRTIWVQLRFDAGGSWQFKDFQYTASR